MYEFLTNPSFLENKSKNKHHFFKDVKMDLPSWDDILHCLDENVSKKSKLKILDNLGFVILETQSISPVQDFLQHILSTVNRPVSAHCYISFLSTSKTFGRHNDDSDVYFWQVQGKTKWIVEDETIAEYILEPNDMIYVPKKMIHEVFPLSPRAGISFGVDY